MVVVLPRSRLAFALEHVAALVCVVLLAAAWTCQACGGAVPSPAQEAALDADRAAQVACVEKFEAGSRALLKSEIDACRANVKADRDAGP